MTSSVVAHPEPAGSSSEGPLLEVRDLRVHLESSRGLVRAVDGVDLDLKRGEVLGIVGESGSGKSVLMRSLMALHPPRDRIAVSTGSVLFEGVDIRTLNDADLRRIWGRKIGIVLQDPMTALNPVVRIGRQITEALQLYSKLSTRAARSEAKELLAAVGVGDPDRRLDQYPSQLSGGLRQRVTIAIAIAADPDLLLLDEPTTALDVTVQAQILALLHRLGRERRIAMIIVTHDLGIVASFADQIAVMYAGRIVERASVRKLFGSPAMPYSDALLSSSPTLDATPDVRLQAIEGRPPDLTLVETGCRFEPRCRYAEDVCAERLPPLEEISPGHSCRCWFPLRGGA